MILSSFGPANRIARTAETHPLTWRLRDDGATVGLAEYQSKNGYAGLRKALKEAEGLIRTVRSVGYMLSVK